MINFEFQTNIENDDVIIKVIDYIKVAPFTGSPNNCNSDLDYYGYEDFTFEVYDFNGKQLTITDFQTDLIETKIREYAINLKDRQIQ